MLKRMTILLGVTLAVMMAAASVCSAADIAFIHSERIRVEYTGARDIDNQLQASVNDWRAQARDLETGIQSMLGELDSQRLLLSQEAVREKEQAVQQKQMEYESFLNDVWGVGGLAARREAELWQPIIERINVILSDIGAAGEYDMIFDAAGGTIVYAAPGADLTDQVLEQLNGTTE